MNLFIRFILLRSCLTHYLTVILHFSDVEDIFPTPSMLLVAGGSKDHQVASARLMFCGRNKFALSWDHILYSISCP